jgi:hypothetical protein
VEQIGRFLKVREDLSWCPANISSGRFAAKWPAANVAPPSRPVPNLRELHVEIPNVASKLPASLRLATGGKGKEPFLHSGVL